MTFLAVACVGAGSARSEAATQNPDSTRAWPHRRGGAYPPPGADAAKAEQLFRRPIELERNIWYPVRVTFGGDTAIVQVNDTVSRASHPVLGLPKTALNLLVFGETAGFRNLKIMTPSMTDR